MIFDLFVYTRNFSTKIGTLLALVNEYLYSYLLSNHAQGASNTSSKTVIALSAILTAPGLIDSQEWLPWI